MKRTIHLLSVITSSVTGSNAGSELEEYFQYHRRIYATIEPRGRVLPVGGVLERTTIGDAWVRNMAVAMMCFGLSGLLRLAEFWIQNGTAGVQ